ncbi:hypothetical protein [Ferroglobus sp.]|uniref:hypothetical protein n=1 Tax=Ferroglobus sp. TaxID=2614230 RepID=UPI0025B99CF2|nr:hypothetical protein [Ferroglobus sp.]
MEERPSEKEIVKILHAILYAFEATVGTPGSKVLIHVSRKIPEIFGKFGFDLRKGENPEESVKKLLEILEETGMLKDTEFKRIDEHTFEFRLGECSLSDSNVHELLKSEKVFCPYSIAVAAVLREVTGRDVVLSESELTEKGSVTKMRLYKYVVL